MEESSPTAPEAPKPSPQERMEKLNQTQRAKRRKGFILGLLVGQLLILALDFGGNGILYLLRDRVNTNPDYPLEALVFLGMTTGIVVTGLLIFFVLGLQGAGYVFGKKKIGFFRAVGRGMLRCFKAAWAVGLTLGIIGGTGWFLIPQAAQDKMVDKAKTEVDHVRDKAETWVREVLTPPPDEEEAADPPADEE